MEQLCAHDLRFADGPLQNDLFEDEAQRRCRLPRQQLLPGRPGPTRRSISSSSSAGRCATCTALAYSSICNSPSCERGQVLATAARALEGIGFEDAQKTVQLLSVHIGLLVAQVEELALALPVGEQGRCHALASVGEACRKTRAGGVAGSGPQRRAEQLARVCRALLHHWERPGRRWRRMGRMSSTTAIPDAVHLATDTGQNSVVVFGIVILGLLVLITLCVYLFPAFAARGRFSAPTLAGTLRDVALVCVTVALAIYLFGLMCTVRLENEWYTCGPQRYGYSSPVDRPGLENMEDSLFPVSSVCRWSDGYAYDFVPAFVNPVVFTLLSLAAIGVIAAGAALTHTGARRDLAARDRH
ncbi:DUF6415 family natural product biosynthesis protein [Streptomyces peucetius]|uniref:DUF6415 family natural product biosynthesis protein n=1 Tax=Streptomyces peucetius TaxID=1950 RepID=A0ABY6IL53_STRPE|nr:DUF6415 family natural product biosynthesis protein [Streptomyces peucetius]UYQ66619.1 DUF6415 family natural product biosynthesis protein [Streptomyces peucetius]